jgi:hypothetical protein
MQKILRSFLLILPISIFLCGCSANPNTGSTVKKTSSTVSSSVVEQEYPVVQSTLDWIGVKFDKVEENAKYNNETIMSGNEESMAGYLSGYLSCSGEQYYTYFTKDTDDRVLPRLVVKDGIIVAYGSALEDGSENIYNFIKDTPFIDVKPTIKGADDKGFINLIWKASNGYFVIKAMQTDVSDYKTWVVWTYCYLSDGYLDNNDYTSSSTESSSGDVTKTFVVLNENQIANIFVVFTKDAGLEIVKTKANDVQGNTVIYKDTREIGEYYYYHYEVDHNGCDVDDYCVDTNTGDLYQGSNSIDLTPVN